MTPFTYSLTGLGLWAGKSALAEDAQVSPAEQTEETSFFERPQLNTFIVYSPWAD